MGFFYFTNLIVTSRVNGPKVICDALMVSIALFGDIFTFALLSTFCNSEFPSSMSSPA